MRNGSHQAMLLQSSKLKTGVCFILQGRAALSSTSNLISLIGFEVGRFLASIALGEVFCFRVYIFFSIPLNIYMFC